ncbi:PAS domain-containing protein [Dongia rigui]|uniref:PAS domain-containing protein n=1 Tax=Dongia rigui TaxID=940149 RepID=A0ABU5DWG0_9PROT|nr:PAS domain-containing protein [Dongia rigui]MDY0871649.1 PAS domain-containing protein [Dongia rigui]
MGGFDADAFAAGIHHPHLQRFFAYWRAKAGGRDMPTRADLDPIDFRYALGYVVLVDVERHPLRFRFRLYGSGLVNYFGDGDYTGKYADELLPADYAPFVVEAYTAAVEGRVPRYAARDLVMNQQRLIYKVLTLPLADAKQPDEIGMLAIVMLPIERKPVTAP